MDHFVAAALARGLGVVLVVGGIADLGRADEIRKGIYRCARHRNVTAEAGAAGRLAEAEEMGIRKAAGRGNGYELHYRIWDKRAGRAHVIESHGADRSAWPYDPRRAASAEERQSWAGRDETGREVIHE